MEIKELYNEVEKTISKTLRKENAIEDGHYYITVVVFIENDNGEILLKKPLLEKDDKWATITAHPISDKDCLEEIINEIKEELGIRANKKELKKFKTIKTKDDFIDIYYLNKNISLKDIIIQKEEVETVNWFKKEQINGLITKRLFIPSHINFYKYFIEYKSR